MYTSYIGKKFLAIYRKNQNLPKEYSAQEFFEENFFPIFFDSETHLMHVGNSPFFQKPTEEAIILSGSKSRAQLNNLKAKIAAGLPSLAIYVGFAAEDLQATSSGQLTSMDFQTSSEDMYASWIGQALSIGVSGGFGLLIDKEEILWSLYEGWAIYRKFLIQTPNLKDKQIETWNGHWLCHAFGNDYDADFKDDIFNSIRPQDVLGKLAIPTVDWVQIIFALARKYPNISVSAYAYQLSQTNITLGFIQLLLPEVTNLIQLKEKIYTEPTATNPRDFEDLYTTFYNFKNACKLGTIGLRAIEPDKLRQFMPNGSISFAQDKELKIKTKEDFSQFKIFKTWIIAMLSNKTELNALAAEAAKALITFELKETRTNVNKQRNKDALSAKNQREFIEKLIAIMVEDDSVATIFKQLKDMIIQIPPDLFPFFLTLIRFEYHFQKSVKS